MTKFFDTIHDKFKLHLPTGEVLKDTAIIPDFVKNSLGMDVDKMWQRLQEYPDHPVEQPIKIQGNDPVWITGAHPALNYRGNAIKRDKIWFQKEYTLGMRRYGYTGWQWKVSGGVKDVSEVPLVDAMFEKISGMVGHDMNAIIATRYKSGQDNIGFHSDKVKDFEDGSCFVVIKLGESRKFEFSWDEPAVENAKQIIRNNKDKVAITKAKQAIKDRQYEEIFYSEELNAGTAIIVGMNANARIKHGVPSIDQVEHVSGSLVGRFIKTIIPWDDVEKKIIPKGTKRKRDRLDAEIAIALPVLVEKP